MDDSIFKLINNLLIYWMNYLKREALQEGQAQGSRLTRAKP
jgi:hypothetical protein